MFVGAVAFSNQAAAADCTIVSTLRAGSVGAEVSCLQTIVGATADGKFGPMTKAAVMAWQAGHGLVADGVVGAMTRAALMGAPTGNFPAGCTSASGYSSTTGVKCDTGASSGLPAGCTSTAGYSPTTGAKCDGTGGTPSTDGPLVGGAGDVTVTELSSPSSATKVGEGDIATKVFGVEYEADDSSDLSLTSMKITLLNAGTGSSKLNRYAKSVSVWYEGKKVGSADVADFSEDSNTYTKSISLSDLIIRAGVKGKVYIAVDAVDNIDSADVGSAANTWTLTVVSTRYIDATGVVLTDNTTSIANTLVFDSLSNTNDVELKVNLSSSTPSAATVKVSTTSDTNQVELLKFTLKAQGSDMSIDQIPVLFTSSETDLDQVTSNVTLKIDGQTFNESVVTTNTATATILFNNLGLGVLSAGDTITGTVLADINDIESSTFDEGTTLDAAITSALVTATSGNYIDVEDVNGDQLVTGDRTGSAQGNTLTFRSTGVNAVMGTPSYDKTVDTNGNITQVIYTIPVTVTSFGNTLYMGQTAQLSATATASNAFALVFQNSSAPTTSDVAASGSYTLSTTDATIDTNGYRLDDGQAKHFTIEVTLTTPTTANNSYRVALKQLKTFTDAGLGLGGSAQTLLPVEQFQTAYKLITS